MFISLYTQRVSERRSAPVRSHRLVQHARQACPGLCESLIDDGNMSWWVRGGCRRGALFKEPTVEGERGKTGFRF